jgi:UDP-N-acetyl-D-glucosamine dehydrogenase
MNQTSKFDLTIIGLGYVGLPLGLQFAKSGCRVLGLDIDPAKIKEIEAGRSYIRHIPAEDVAAQVKAGRFTASSDFSLVKDSDAVVICVPTPLNKNREPDISYILKTGEAIAPYLKTEDGGQRSEGGGLRPGSGRREVEGGSRKKLVVLESTTYPGTTDEDLRKVLEKGSGLKAGVDFHLAFSPEREDPGNPQSKVAEIPKVVGGLTPACLEQAKELYGKAIKKLVPVSSTRAAEATKLMENIFRSVNIALVNELKIIYGSMGIDIWEVIEAAKTKPFGFMPFYPGPGLGGHCIPIDPFYLTWKAREYGHPTRFIELAGEINTAMPEFVVQKVGDALNQVGRSIKGSKILLLGVAYKADVDDERESPSFVLLEKLEAKGAQVEFHDPFVPTIRPSREHPKLAGRKSSAINTTCDLVLIAAAHSPFKAYDFSGLKVPLVDTRNCVSPNNRPKLYFQA